MKKNFIYLGLIPIFTIPIIITSSCSNEVKETDYQSQYDLFTKDSIIEENLKDNLALSIDDNLIGNIYSIPTLQPGINYSFSYKVIDKKLHLSIKLYDRENSPISYEDIDGVKKHEKIIVIDGFGEIPLHEQALLDSKYTAFKDLKIAPTPDSNELPSSINLNDLQQWISKDNFPPVPGTENNFSLLSNDITGVLEISFLIFQEGYPLKRDSYSGSKKIQYKTSSEIDASNNLLYKNANIPNNQKINKVNFPGYASSTANMELSEFFTASGIPAPKEAPSGYKFKNIIESNDTKGTMNITFNLYNITTGLLVPTTENKHTSISGFEESNPKLSKATNDAFNHYKKELLKVKPINLYPPFDKPKNPTFDLAVFDGYNFQYTLDADIDFSLFKNGYIKYNGKLEVKREDGTWHSINPSTSTNDVYSSTIKDLSINWTGFLTEIEYLANLKYTKISEKVKALVGNSILSNAILADGIFGNIDFDELWSKEYEIIEDVVTDPLGIVWNDNGLKVDYNFAKSDGKNYDVFSSVKGGITYKWVKVKASVASVDTNYEYSAPTNLELEFKFVVSQKN